MSPPLPYLGEVYMRQYHKHPNIHHFPQTIRSPQLGLRGCSGFSFGSLRSTVNSFVVLPKWSVTYLLIYCKVFMCHLVHFSFFLEATSSYFRSSSPPEYVLMATRQFWAALDYTVSLLPGGSRMLQSFYAVSTLSVVPESLLT